MCSKKSCRSLPTTFFNTSAIIFCTSTYSLPWTLKWGKKKLWIWIRCLFLLNLFKDLNVLQGFPNYAAHFFDFSVGLVMLSSLFSCSPMRISMGLNLGVVMHLNNFFYKSQICISCVHNATHNSCTTHNKSMINTMLKWTYQPRPKP